MGSVIKKRRRNGLMSYNLALAANMELVVLLPGARH